MSLATRNGPVPSVALVCFALLVPVDGFSGVARLPLACRPHVSSPWSSSLCSSVDPAGGSEGPVFDDVPHEFAPLFGSAAAAAEPRSLDLTAGAHEPFRFEWGTWVNETRLESLVDRLNEVRLGPGAFDALIDEFGNGGDGDGSDGGDPSTRPARVRVAGGDDWFVILHALPAGSYWRGQWPTGSWAMVKALTGVAEVAMLRGPDRDGLFQKKSLKDLRGGGDGSLGGGAAAGGSNATKYVGGPLRSYSGKSGRTTVLEVVILPPAGQRKSGDGAGPDEMDELRDIAGTLSIAPPEEESQQSASTSGGDGMGQNATESAEGTDTPSADGASGSLNEALGMTFENVGGLNAQLEAIARRVLASRADPAAARRLGVGHVRGILLSGPPGCGKTLLARELASILGAREPQIVNGPEILDKFIGEAEKKVRDLFLPAEEEYAQVGDDSALHIIILDEMDAIARKRGTMTSDTTGVRDSVVNQLLAKMDGVREAPNVLVVGLTNRPELLDPALLRPGRLEVQLRVELPDQIGRRDILRIHTRRMRKTGALGVDAADAIDDMGERGMAARTEHFSGAELAGLVRSAASFALARTVEASVVSDKGGGSTDDDGTVAAVTVADIETALTEVRPALGRQDEALKLRFPRGVSACSPSMERVLRDLKRFAAPVRARSSPPGVESLLLVGAGGNGGSGATALAAWAAAQASSTGSSDFVRFVTALDVITGAGGGGGDEARAAALADKFAEAREMGRPFLVLDDVDQICAGTGVGGYSTVVLAALRALLRTPPSSGASRVSSQAGEEGSNVGTMRVIAATSRSDAACVTLHELFDETVVVPLLSEVDSISKLFSASLGSEVVADTDAMASMIIQRIGSVGCKTALRLAERAAASAHDGAGDVSKAQLEALEEILEDLAGDEATAEKMCEIF